MTTLSRNAFDSMPHQHFATHDKRFYKDLLYGCAMFTGIPILLYHRVGLRDGTRMDRYTVSPERFVAQMEHLARQSWQVVPLEEVLDRGSRTQRARRVAVTFDDGFASNREYAWPVLARHGFPTTTFVVSDKIGSVNTWDDAEMPRYPLLTDADIEAADPQLLAFQSHGATHAALTLLDDTALELEVQGSKARLEALTGRPITFFAYPFGSLSARVHQAARAAGYRAACSCRSGRNNSHTDRFLLRRVEILDGDIGWRLRVKLSTGFNFE